jgi:hypothetical protein
MTSSRAVDFVTTASVLAAMFPLLHLQHSFRREI